MKTFEKFIQDSGAYGPPVSLTRKPVFRSSAMFPVIGNQYYSSRILFMGYWILKREIAEIGLLYTLRDQGGNLLARKSNTINAPRSFVVELNDLLPEQLGGSEFFGSIELEVFSSRDMVFPYPAFVLEFYNETFSTCVHTTGRVYNDIEDLKDCDDYKVSESGFDVYGIPGIDSFFAFVNGPLVNADAIELEAINSRNQSLKAFVADLQIQPYQTVFVDLKKYMPGLDSFLDGTAGTVKIKHNLKGFFPRFLAGNFSRRERNLSITHTYYDCSPLTGADAYWKRASSDLFDSSIYAPIFLDGSRKTELIFYPIHSPSEYEIDLNFLDAEGNSLLKITGYKKCGKAENKLFKIDFNQVLKGRGIALDKVKGVFVSKSWPGSEMTSVDS